MNPEKKALNDISLLYVEDEEYTLEAVGELLKNKVNEINLAKNGREGLHFFKERYPDIVVTDIRMPVMSGLEMAREIRSLSPRTEIIVTSAHDDTRFLLDAIDLNISQYVMKPIAKERLFSAVDRSARKIFLERMGEEKKEILEELVQDRTTELKKTGEALDTSLKKLKKAMEAVIQAMTLVVESRDPYTAGHQRKVANLSRAIAEEMGLEPDRIDGIHMAGVVHDIGKISVPAEILSKPAGLSELELRLIQTHSEAGHCILKEIDFPWPIAEIILQHHERLDGSGYPRGLAGDGIMLEARIIAVADVVDAIASHRPYRPAMGLDRALQHIEQYRGIRFDPYVVDACLRVFRENGYQLI